MTLSARWRDTIPVVVVVVLLSLFMVAPLAAIISRIGSAGVLPASSAVLRTVRFSIVQAAVSAAAAILLALPVAFAVSHFRFVGRKVLLAASLLPFVLPSIIVAVAMVTFFGRNGAVNRFFGTQWNLVYSFAGIVLAHVYYNVSLAVRVLGGAWAGIDRRYADTARSLGDGGWGTFTRVTLPLLRPAAATAFTLVFLYSFLSFGIVLVFGGVRYATLEVAIYREFFVDLDFGAAALYASVQFVFTLAFVTAASRWIGLERAGIAKSDQLFPRLSEAPRAIRRILVPYLLLFALFLVGPLASLFSRALGDAGSLAALFVSVPGTPNVEQVIRSSTPALIVRSVLVATTSGTLAVLIATWLSLSLRGGRTKVAEAFVYAPMGVSVVSVALSLRLLWGGVIPDVLIVIVGQAVMTLPIVFRIVRSGVEELGDRYVNAARVLGAGRFAVFRDVELPLLRRTVSNALAYGVALAFADFTIVLGVGRGRIVTFPVAIYRLIGFRSFDMAVSLAVVYVLLCLVLFVLIDTTSERRVGA